MTKRADIKRIVRALDKATRMVNAATASTPDAPPPTPTIYFEVGGGDARPRLQQPAPPALDDAPPARAPSRQRAHTIVAIATRCMDCDAHIADTFTRCPRCGSTNVRIANIESI